jgi:putative peptidoglycan binding protein
MAWRLAKSLETLRSQVNAKWPGRSKSSDGSIGDEGHSSRTSDHNPDPAGVVRAIDITHDPKGGFDSYGFADMLLKKQDRRLKYVISNRRIGSGPAGPAAGVWRPYTGTNPHDHHCHISVAAGPAGDATDPWNIDGVAAPSAKVVDTFVPAPLTLIPGSTDPEVERLQKLLGCVVTGKYEPKSETEWALRLFQVRHKLDPDGRCGPMTWKALTAA